MAKSAKRASDRPAKAKPTGPAGRVADTRSSATKAKSPVESASKKTVVAVKSSLDAKSGAAKKPVPAAKAARPSASKAVVETKPTTGQKAAKAAPKLVAKPAEKPRAKAPESAKVPHSANNIKVAKKVAVSKPDAVKKGPTKNLAKQTVSASEPSLLKVVAVAKPAKGTDAAVPKLTKEAKVNVAAEDSTPMTSSGPAALTALLPKKIAKSSALRSGRERSSSSRMNTVSNSSNGTSQPPLSDLTCPFNKEELKEWYDILLERRNEVYTDISGLEKDAMEAEDGHTTPLHAAERGSDADLQEVSLGLAGEEKELLWQIDRALRKIDLGRPLPFGLCEHSRKPIARNRLQLMPWTPLSIEGAQYLEENALTIQDLLIED